MKLSFLLLFSLLLSSCDETSNKQNAQQKPTAIPVRVEKPESRMVKQWQEFTGRFQASQRVEIRARVSGYLSEAKFNDGQIVQKGDVLFIIDQRPFEIDLNSAQARFDLANSEFNRSEKLLKSKVISQEAYDKSLQERRVSEAELKSAQLNLEFTAIKAPFTGKISRRLVDQGSLISGGNDSSTLLTTLIKISPIELYFEGSESDFLKYLRAEQALAKSDKTKAVQPVFAKLQDEDDFVHEGRINFLDNELNRDTGTIQMRATFDNESGFLEAGLFARIRLSWSGSAQKLLIPDEAIGTQQTKKYLYVLDDQNKAFRKYVTLGNLTKDGLRIIEEGLLPDDQIVVGSLHMVHEGSLIEPIMKEAVQDKKPQIEIQKEPIIKEEIVLKIEEKNKNEVADAIIEKTTQEK